MNPTIDELLARYYEGETTLEEEKKLRQYFQQEHIPVHLQRHAAQFRYFTEARSQQPSVAFSQQLMNELTGPKPVRTLGWASWGMRVAAGLALLLLGFTGGMLYNQKSTRQPVMADADARSIRSMKQVLAFDHRPKTSASERIGAINQSYELDRVDGATTQLLINTLNFDANVNVRLAACQALLRFENEPGVREALIQSLAIQTDPNVQITLIELLVAIREKRATEPLQRLARSRQALEAVRQKAEEGVSRLTSTNQVPS